MNNVDSLKLAEIRLAVARTALTRFVEFHLPERLRRQFVGEEAREVFGHCVVHGNNVWPEHLVEKYGGAVRRAQNFLIAIPRYRKLVEADDMALMDWGWFRDLVETDEAAYARDIAATYQMIERDMWADAESECRELGLIE
ncbi:hypothetical protein [Paraburkholderia sp. J8-2]|uniref:hypothetical protein n=1 Tax=Paraburkholderia sp. J8-2 TaxID=2805440 RepID=UPI002AB75652|nr:hypothetical protein [Paraburkholderia sp. J8-2]